MLINKHIKYIISIILFKLSAQLPAKATKENRNTMIKKQSKVSKE